MLKLMITTAALLVAAPAFATSQDCKRQGGGYMCGGNTYIDGSKASSESEAVAIAAQLQGQAQDQEQSQGQFQSSNYSDRTNINISDNDDSVNLATPAGGGCTWGVNVAVPGDGGFGICGTTKNQTAAALAVIADGIGNPCAGENALAVAALMKAPLLKGVTLDCK